ncbi:MAG: HD domain-containing protein [Rubrobacteraceae bacterium]|nr:HD domain-containing protein [Rubrobacteraceae bacterium]
MRQGMRQIKSASTLASPRAGLLRVALTGIVALMLAWAFPDAWGALLAAGLALLFGVCLIVGWPAILLRERLVRVFLDTALVGVLVAYTGGAGSPFFSLLLLAALGIAWIETRTKVALAAAALVAGYPAAVIASGGVGALGSTPVALRTGLVALFCVAVAFLGSEMQGFRRLAIRLSSTLANEIDRVESDELLISKFAPVVKVLSLEGILGWTVEAAHTVGGGPYAHVASLKGNNHRTILEGDSDVCPSWWHPSIQRLVLRSCREGDTVRSEEEIHGIEGFMAIPLGTDEDEKWGAMIVGGGEYGAEEERALKLLAGRMGPALEDAEDAPGGLDQLTGLPNRASLHRVLRRELSYGRPFTVLAMQPTGSGESDLASGGSLLQRIGQRLTDGRQRAFRYGDEEFVVVLSGSGESKARQAALALQQQVSEEAGRRGDLRSTAAVGWVFAETGDEGSVLDAALRALEKAKVQRGGLSGVPAEAQRLGRFVEDEKKQVLGIARTLVEALEAKDPYIKEHLRAVSNLALRIGSEISLPQGQMEALTSGAMLHDLGKIGIPDRILQKSGRLTEDEYAEIKRHPMLGVSILTPVRELASALPVIRHHHERFDGKGYPDGLRGEDIPLIARVVSVADAFDSMVRARPYGYGISRKAALGEIEENSGTQFDPRIVRALLEVVYAPSDQQANSAG